LFPANDGCLGRLERRPGCGVLNDATVSSVIVKRQRRTDHQEPHWETYVPSRILCGLIPDILIQQYEFWKESETVIKGYSRVSDEWSNYELTVELSADGGSAVVKRKNRSEALCLLNPLKSKKDSALGRLAALFCRVDRLCNVLFWSRSHPVGEEEAEITLIELPVLKARFQMSVDEDGKVKLNSLDHNGKFQP
jgi:hypothetical protein